MSHLELLSRLAMPLADGEGKIVLLVLDGLGDIRTAAQPLTPLEQASLPNLDALARRSALGRLVPVAPGVTPGSGPGHLALFGHDPTQPAADVGRGVLEALGEGLPVGPGDVAARGNFATADAAGNLTDRRAGRIPTEESRRLCAAIRAALRPALPVDGVEVTVEAGEGYRFVLLLHGDGLSPRSPTPIPSAWKCRRWRWLRTTRTTRAPSAPRRWCGGCWRRSKRRWPTSRAPTGSCCAASRSCRTCRR